MAFDHAWGPVTTTVWAWSLDNPKMTSIQCPASLFVVPMGPWRISLNDSNYPFKSVSPMLTAGRDFDYETNLEIPIY